jgi:hypothetical protein
MEVAVDAERLVEVPRAIVEVVAPAPAILHSSGR